MDYKSLNSDIQLMIQTAEEFRNKAYAPFSKFKVGAAVLCDDGTIYGGCNIENSSYSLTNCAERTATFKAVSDGKLKLVAVAVCAVYLDDFVSPCGACRQVLREFCRQPRELDVYMVKSSDGSICKMTLEQLLPKSFKLD